MWKKVTRSHVIDRESLILPSNFIYGKSRLSGEFYGFREVLPERPCLLQRVNAEGIFK